MARITVVTEVIVFAINSSSFVVDDGPAFWCGVMGVKITSGAGDSDRDIAKSFERLQREPGYISDWNVESVKIVRVMI
jgi:hypothetical protein